MYFKDDFRKPPQLYTERLHLYQNRERFDRPDVQLVEIEQIIAIPNARFSGVASLAGRYRSWF